MKEFLLKIVRNSGVRKAFLALVVAVAAAAGLSFSTGCASFGAFTPPAAVAAACVADAVQGLDPETLTLGQARDLVAQLHECGAPLPAPDADAGAE